MGVDGSMFSRLWCVVLADKVEVLGWVKNQTFLAVGGIYYLVAWSVPHCCSGGRGLGEGFLGIVYRFIIPKLAECL